MLSRVKKRDGREVPFDEKKIHAAVHKAMAAVGEEDFAFAAEVAAVVRMTLEQRSTAPPGAPLGTGPHETAPAAGSCPGIEEIQNLVEQALVELGRASVAKAYILYRDRRARIREVLEVRESRAGSGAPPSAREALVRGARVQVREAERASPWSKGRIVAALMNEADLSRELSETIAARVEEKVFASGLKRITSGLIRELVDNELVGAGLASALRRQASFGVPAHDLRRLLSEREAEAEPEGAAAGEELAELSTEARISGEVLRRFALQEVYGERAGERHLAGDLHIVALARPHQVLWSALPVQLFASGTPSAGASFAWLEELARAARGAAHGIVLEEAGTILQPLAREARSTAGLGAWLRALTATARGASRKIDLGPPARQGTRSTALTSRLIEELAALEEGAFAPRLFLDDGELGAALADAGEAPARLEAIERLLLAGRLVPSWDSDEERFAAPGCHRLAGERAALSCGGAVALNLPRLALRAGPWREERLLEGLAELATDAADALASLQAFQHGVRAIRAAPARGRIAYALAPVGLREALQWLSDGEIRPEQGARLLGFLADLVRRLGAERRLSLALTPFFGGRACVRFAALDAELPQHAQRLLFERDAGAALEPGTPYHSGYRLSPVAGRAPWSAEAELLATVPVGALHPLPEDRSRGGLLSLGEACRRFAALRREPPPSELELARRPWSSDSHEGPHAGSRTTGPHGIRPDAIRTHAPPHGVGRGARETKGLPRVPEAPLFCEPAGTAPQPPPPHSAPSEAR